MKLGRSVRKNSRYQLSKRLRSDFHRDGFVLLPEFFSPVEVDRLRTTSEAAAVAGDGQGSQGVAGGAPQVAFSDRNYTKDLDVSELHLRLLRVVEALLGDEVRHVHSKLLDETEALVGGSWPWHQDYWYAYQCGFLYPDLVNSVVALYRTTSENGALQVVRGSHKMGRLDHVLLDSNGGRRDSPGTTAGGGPVWIGADPARVQAATAHLQVIDCIMNPGDVVVFHSNCLHRSGQSCSTHKGRALLCDCYRAAWNEPVQKADAQPVRSSSGGQT
jgi:hypothetical protein